MLAKPESKLVMPAGNCSVLNMVSSQMVKCLLIKQLVEEMMPSIPFLAKPVLVNTSQEPFSLIWNQQSLMKSELGHIDNFSIQNNLFLEKRMLLTTLLEAITQLGKKL